MCFSYMITSPLGEYLLISGKLRLTQWIYLILFIQFLSCAGLDAKGARDREENETDMALPLRTFLRRKF